MSDCSGHAFIRYVLINLTAQPKTGEIDHSKIGDDRVTCNGVDSSMVEFVRYVLLFIRCPHTEVLTCIVRVTEAITL